MPQDIDYERFKYSPKIMDGSKYKYTLIKAHPSLPTDMFYIAVTEDGSIVLASIDQDVQTTGKHNTLSGASFLLSNALFSGQLYCNQDIGVMIKIGTIISRAYKEIKNASKK